MSDSPYIVKGKVSKYAAACSCTREVGLCETRREFEREFFEQVFYNKGSRCSTLVPTRHRMICCACACERGFLGTVFDQQVLHNSNSKGSRESRTNTSKCLFTDFMGTFIGMSEVLISLSLACARSLYAGGARV